MIKVSVSEQDIIDSCRVETEGSSVLLGELTAALKQSAINEDPFACAFHQMAGSSHVAIGAVKCQFQATLLWRRPTDLQPLMCPALTIDRAVCHMPHASPEFPSKRRSRSRQTTIARDLQDRSHLPRPDSRNQPHDASSFHR